MKRKTNKLSSNSVEKTGDNSSKHKSSTVRDKKLSEKLTDKGKVSEGGPGVMETDSQLLADQEDSYFMGLEEIEDYRQNEEEMQ